MFYAFIPLTLLSFSDKIKIDGWKPEEGGWKLLTSA